jgi:hypothetical protein
VATKEVEQATIATKEVEQATIAVRKNLKSWKRR